LSGEGDKEASWGDAVETKRFFDRVGPWFYSFFFTLVGYRASLKYFLRANHPQLGLRQGAKVLDAGIGTGFLTVNLLREVPVALSVVGLDFSLGMLLGLKRWLRKLTLQGRVRLLLGDMRKTPFRKDSFDLVVYSAAMEYLPEVEEAIAECGRVLGPGGRLLIISTRRTLMGKLIAVLWRSRMLEPARIEEFMNRSGMRHIERLRFPWYFPYVNWWGMVLLGEKKK